MAPAGRGCHEFRRRIMQFVGNPFWALEIAGSIVIVVPGGQISNSVVLYFRELYEELGNTAMFSF